MLGNLLGGFIIIVVGMNLMPVIADSTYGVRYNSTGGTGHVNVTGATSTVVGLVPLFYALGIMSAGIAITVSGLRNAGVM